MSFRKTNSTPKTEQLQEAGIASFKRAIAPILEKAVRMGHKSVQNGMLDLWRKHCPSASGSFGGGE